MLIKIVFIGLQIIDPPADIAEGFDRYDFFQADMSRVAYFEAGTSLISIEDVEVAAQCIEWLSELDIKGSISDYIALFPKHNSEYGGTIIIVPSYLLTYERTQNERTTYEHVTFEADSYVCNGNGINLLGE